MRTPLFAAAVRGQRRVGAPRGQSLTEVAVILPILILALLAAVDYAQVLSARQRLEHALHLATVQLAQDPTLNLTTYLQGESGLTPLQATSVYTTNSDGSDQVLITAQYNYRLSLPGLRDIQLGALSNGMMRLSVQAAGIAATSPPTLTVVTVPLTGISTIRAAAPNDATTPAGLTPLTCILSNATGTHSGSCPLVWAIAPTGTYTATVRQVNGVASPPITTTVP